MFCLQKKLTRPDNIFDSKKERLQRLYFLPVLLVGLLHKMVVLEKDKNRKLQFDHGILKFKYIVSKIGLMNKHKHRKKISYY